ncbi:MAG: class I SAM-dependent methyltransferase [Sphingomonadales bacterium]|nr:MAG: class I SAM-dependent methyltransferase [Sphingomonadales bacterium]
MNPILAFDDLEAQARAGWDFGEKLCTECNSYHQTWGILRAAKSTNAAENDRHLLAPLLDRQIAPGGNILIAGSADAGLLQLLVSTVSARPITISIVDRCPAPIALINALERPSGVTVDAWQCDLTAFEGAARYDLIMSHSMLPFVDPPTRVAILERLRDSLAPEGRLYVVVRTAPLVSAEVSDDHDQAWLARAMGKLSTIPELVRYCGDALPARLTQVAGSRRSRAYVFREAAEVVALLATAGLEVERHIVGDVSGSLAVAGRTIERQSHIFVSRKS